MESVLPAMSWLQKHGAASVTKALRWIKAADWRNMAPGDVKERQKGQVQYDEKPFERSKKLFFAGWVVCPMVFLRAYPIFPEKNFVWSLTLFNLFCNGTWEAVWPTRAAQTRPKTLGWASSRKDVGLASSSWLCDF